ncbi:MAG: hypothetical protein ACFBQW_09225 [Sphingomonadaceae bacterium]
MLAAALSPAEAAAPRSLGIFGEWGAFRDGDRGKRCYAIARPRGGTGGGDSGAFASIGHWPRLGIRGQVHFRLGREKRRGSAVLLRIDDDTFQLAAGGADAWAPDARADAAIVAAMRGGVEMRIETRSARGGRIVDRYLLRGAATAIDAAALACARGTGRD